MIRMAKTVLNVLNKPIEEAKELGNGMAESSEFSGYIKKNIISLLN